MNAIRRFAGHMAWTIMITVFSTSCDAGKEAEAPVQHKLVSRTGASSQNLKAIPAPGELKSLCQSLAVIDRLLEDRFSGTDPVDFDYTMKWEGEIDGSAFVVETEKKDKLWIWFGANGIVIKGNVSGKETDPMRDAFNGELQHGIRLAPGMLEGFPKELDEFFTETVFSVRNSTFIIWRLNGDDRWHTGTAVKRAEDKQDPDGSLELLSYVDSDPERCLKNFHHDNKTAASAARKIFAHEPLSQAIIDELGSRSRISEVADEMKLIGYPIAE